MSLRIVKFLGVEASTVGTSAVQLFTVPNKEGNARQRTGVQLTNCDTADDIYVSRTNDVASTNFIYLIAAGESIYIPWETPIPVWIIASAATTYYRADEVIARPHV